MKTPENTLLNTQIKNIAIIGSSGAIGSALANCINERFPDAMLYTFSRSVSSNHMALNPTQHQHIMIDYEYEDSIAMAAALASEKGPLDLAIVATGMLHDEKMKPEKSLKDLAQANMMALYQANCITPALLAKYFIPRLNPASPAIFAALSARVGSISDNGLGGWYAYRASKAALNMVIKNAGIETARRNKSAIIVGLHPGTVDSELSKPFQANVPEGKLFTPTNSANYLLDVLLQLEPEASGKCFAWDGQEIKP